MIRLVQTPRTAYAHIIIFISVIAAFALVASLFSTGALQAQSVASKSNAANVANDPDVLGAERLFSAWIEGQIAYRGLPGVAVGVVSDQELVWAKGCGFADVKAKLPMAASTKFRMASHSKLFTAIAIMQLREEGKLGLDDPVVKYLPWFKAKPAGDDDGPITVRDCSVKLAITGPHSCFRPQMNYNVSMLTGRLRSPRRCGGSIPTSPIPLPACSSRR